jgi:membrane protein required for colicin V production
MIGPLSYLDVGLIAVAFISGILAMYRGFTREMLSIISWAVAGVAVLYFVLFHRKFAEDMAAQAGTQVAIAQIAIGALIFLIVLIVVHLITARLSEAILDSRVGMVDHVLGFIFGVLRGFLLVVIPYMFYQHFIPDESKHYDWVRNSQSLPYLKSTGEGLQSLLVNYLPSSLTDPTSPEEQAPTGEQQG